MPTSVLTLFEASLALYPAGEDNTPALDTPVWIGACAERLRLADEFIMAETRPTARRYLKRHPLVLGHTINIDRVWVQDLPDLSGFMATGNRYMLDIVWQDEDYLPGETRNTWKRRTYYGVTVRSDSYESNDLNSTASHFMENQAFDAEFFVESSGTGEPPAPSIGLPMQVQWVGPDGVLPLYDYAGGDFTAIGSGSTYRAQIAYGSFDINFYGVAEPALAIASGTSDALAFIQSVPTEANIPRIEFMRGGVRLASLDSDGRFFAPTIRQAEPTIGTDRFLIYDDAGHTSLAMTISQAETVIARILPSTVTPASITSNATVGTPRIGGAVRPTGIASVASFGTPTVNLTVTPTGIASTSSIGTPYAVTRVYPTGIPSSSALGSPGIQTSWAVAGIASQAAVGSPRVNLTIYPTGIASSVSFGSTRSVLTVTPTGIPSGATFGAVQVITRQLIYPTAIPSPASFGTVQLNLSVRPTAIPSHAAIGIPRGIYGQDVTPTAIPTHAAFGTVRVLQAIDPSAITGLKLWLKADAIGGGLSDGDPVSTWSDSSGEGNDGTSSGGLRPIYHTAVVDGQPAVHFDNQKITLPDAFSGFTSGEFFMVFKLDAFPTSAGGGGIWDFGADINEDYIAWAGDNNNYIGLGSETRHNGPAATSDYASWGLFNVGSAAANYKLRYNGAQIFTDASNVVAFHGFAGAPVIGIGVSAAYLLGSIAEIILFNHVLSSDDRTGLQLYLKAKYPSLPI